MSFLNLSMPSLYKLQWRNYGLAAARGQGPKPKKGGPVLIEKVKNESNYKTTESTEIVFNFFLLGLLLFLLGLLVTLFY